MRKQGEEKLNQMKQFDADKYAGYLTSIISSSKKIKSHNDKCWDFNEFYLGNYNSEVRSLACVILRRNISNTQADS